MRDNEHVKAIREALEEAHNLTFEGDTIGVRRALSGPRNVHLDALAGDLDAANARVNALAEARARRFAEAVEVESERERRTMDSTTDHAARISARIEEYKTLDLIGRNSADDLQHHLRALVKELAEANSLAARLADAVKHHCEHRAVDMGRRYNLTGPEINQLATDLASGAGLHDGDLDAALGDTADGRLMDRRNRPDV